MLKSQLQFLSTLFFLLIFLHTQITVCVGIPVFDLNSVKVSDLDAMMGRACGGKIGQCPPAPVVLDEDAGEMMDSESNRRLLMMQKRYISYDTLKRDLVPCSRPGASYYNCNAQGQPNSYNRGCEIITRCARDISDIKS